MVAALHEATKEGSLVLNHTKTQADYSISPDTPGFLTGNVKIYVVNAIIVLCYDMTLGGGGILMIVFFLCGTFMYSILQCMFKYANEGLRED